MVSKETTTSNILSQLAAFSPRCPEQRYNMDTDVENTELTANIFQAKQGSRLACANNLCRSEATSRTCLPELSRSKCIAPCMFLQKLSGMSCRIEAFSCCAPFPVQIMFSD